MRITRVLGVLITMAMTVTSLSGQTIVWDKTWDSGSNDMGGRIALDTVNNAVYLIGIKRDGSNLVTDDIVTLKYDTDGNFIWVKDFDSDTTDQAYDVEVDKSGFIYVSGMSCSVDGDRIRLIKYDSDSAEIWNTLHFAYTDEYAVGIIVDDSGNTYATGTTGVGPQLVKFDSDGNEVWVNNIEIAMGYPCDVVTAPDGFIYVAGSQYTTENDQFIIRYNSSGDTIWRKLYDEGPEEIICGIAVDSEGNFYLAGYTMPDFVSAADILVSKFDMNGNLLWNETFDKGYDDQGYCIAVDKRYVYIAGSSKITSGDTNELLLLCYDMEGNLMWDTLLVSDAFACGIASDGKSNLYISAETSSGDLRVLKVHHATAVEEPSSPSSPSSESNSVTLEIVNNLSTAPTLRYSVPPNQAGNLSLYSADGRLVEIHPLLSSQTTFTWDARTFPSGVYFVRLIAGSISASGKVLIVR